MVDFAFDPDDLTVKTYEVPGGVTLVRIYAVGGGSPIASAIGMRLEQVPVTPGDTLSIDLGGPPSVDGTEGGYGGGGRTGGEGGGGYDDPNGTRGYGGGGATEIRRGDDSLLVVAGGAGGRAGGLSYYQDFHPFVGVDPPSSSSSPRSPDPQPGGQGVIEYDLWVPGQTGGTDVGAAGVGLEWMVENGTFWGSGGGGGGYGGGSSGGIGFYHYIPTIPPPPEGAFGSTFPGRAGGSFIPESAGGWGIWPGLGAGDGIYVGEDAGGFVRIDALDVAESSGWNVGRLRM